MNDTDVAARLAEALEANHHPAELPCSDCRGDVAKLLPVVREIADQRAAEIVQTAADGSRPHDHVIAEWLDRRAAALRGEAGRV